MGKFRRFVLPVALSIAVHAGIYSGGSTLVAQQQEQKPKITEKVMEEGIAGKKQEGKKPDISALKKEREEYVQELLSALKEGKEIRLSEFLIRSETLEENIRLAERGEFGPSTEEFMQKYAKIVDKAKEYALGAEDEVQALHEFLHRKVFAGYYFGSGSIIDVLGSGWYNCTSSTEMFSALMEDVLGRKDHKVILLDDHLKSFLDGYEIENTAHTWKAAHRKFEGCGLVAPTDILVGGYVAANGIGVEELPEELSKLYEVRIANKGCPTRSKKTPDTKGSGARLPKPGVASGLDAPSYFMPNPEFEITTEAIVKNMRGLYVAYRIAHTWDDKEMLDAELGGEKIKLNPIIIPAGVNWPQVLEKNKSNSAYHLFHGFTPERTKHCSPEMTIPGKTIPEIIEGLSRRGDSRFEEYAKEGICKRFERALMLQKKNEMEYYLEYDFCRNVEQMLKGEYARDKKRGVLWFGIANFEDKGNFDFFLDELRNADDNIKSGAAVGMVMADKGKACGILRGLPEAEKKHVKLELVWGCEDEKTMWEVVSEYEKGGDMSYLLPAVLSTLSGIGITGERRSTLLELAPRAPLQEKLEVARILLEGGDKENAFRIVREFVEEAKTRNGNYPFICGFPEEFLPVVAPLLEIPGYSTGIAYEVIHYGRGREYLPSLKKSLRAALNDESAYGFERERAAFALLMMGVDPLGKD